MRFGLNNRTLDAWGAGLSLFASLATLLCCALPALLVTIGMGAVIVGLVSNVPGLIWVSEHKVLVFTVSGILILCGGVLLFYSSGRSCPLDERQARACTHLKRASVIIYGWALFFYGVGFFFAFLWPA